MAQRGNQVVEVADSCFEAGGADSEVAGGVAVAASDGGEILISWASFSEKAFSSLEPRPLRVSTA